ncbi:MAG: hypothetical protein AAC993_06975 [Dehalococcoides mccartyi]|uniref:hypothetical protein n=1 Tax=Dehalococcoides mccartyi TaxID=61435 RepID=UPI0030F5E38B
MSNNDLITSLAILKTNWDHKKSYLSNFIPFISQCIIDNRPEVLSTFDLKEQVEKRFGISIPHNTIKSILSDMKKLDLTTSKDGIYYPNYSTLTKVNFAQLKQDFLRKLTYFLKGFQRYCKESFGIDISEDEASELLVTLLKSRNIDLLNCHIFGAEFPAASIRDNKFNQILYSYIKNIYFNEPDRWEYFVILLKGQMLSTVLMYNDPNALTRKFKNTDIYLDCPLVLRYLGLEGETSEVPAKELFQLLLDLGAKIKCFKHTRDEVRSILHAAKLSLNDYRDKKLNLPVSMHFIKIGYTPDDIERLIYCLDEILETNGICLVENPQYYYKYALDEEKLIDAIDQSIVYFTENKISRQNDAASLYAIYRLREGNSQYFIEECKAILVTSSRNLCIISYDFFVREKLIKEETLPMAISEHALTNYLWLKNPIKFSDLPQNLLIADCYAAMEPGDDYWREYMEKVEKLRARNEISEAEYFLLKYNSDVKEEIFGRYIRDVPLYDGTPKELIERHNNGLIEKEKAEKEKAQKYTEIVRLIAVVSILIERRLSIERENKYKNKSEDKFNSQKQTIDKTVLRREHLALLFSKIGLFTLYIIIFALGLWISIYEYNGGSEHLRWITGIMAGIFLVVQFIPINNEKVWEKIKNWLYHSANRILIKFFYPQ